MVWRNVPHPGVAPEDLLLEHAIKEKTKQNTKTKHILFKDSSASFWLFLLLQAPVPRAAPQERIAPTPLSF